MKKIIITTVLMLMAAMMPPGVLADTTKNSNTGPGSTNTTKITRSRSGVHTSSNIATLVRELITKANTGYNDSSNNTTGGSVVAGSANASVDNDDAANTEDVDIDQTASTAVSHSALNSMTGPGSTNTASVSDSATVSATTENDADVFTNSYTNANSGNNVSSNNTTGGSIVSGSARSTSRVVSTLNTIMVRIYQ